MFEKIYEKLGIPYGRREINRTFEKHYRRDNAYESLSKIWIRHPEIRPVLLRAVETVFSNGTEMAAITPQDLAFRAYVSALSKNWDDACRQMYEIISVEKGENVDSWIDLGHFLRKIEGFEHASLCILLNPEWTVHFYRSRNDHENRELAPFLKDLERRFGTWRDAIENNR